MAKCDWCQKDMNKVKSCSANKVVLFPDGKQLPSVPHSGDGSCHDCGVSPGKKHHPGCDTERCPRCHGQQISCGCLDDDEEEDDDYEEE